MIPARSLSKPRRVIVLFGVIMLELKSTFNFSVSLPKNGTAPVSALKELLEILEFKKDYSFSIKEEGDFIIFSNMDKTLQAKKFMNDLVNIDEIN